MRDGSLKPSRALGIKLGGGWLLILLEGFLVGRLLEMTQPSWDRALLLDVRGQPHTTATDLMRFIAALASPLVLDGVFLIAVLVLLARRRPRDLLLLVLASPGSVLMVEVLKRVVVRPRPPGLHLAAFDGGSWPSADAASSLALYATVGLIVFRSLKRSRKARIFATTTALLIAVLIALVGFARVFLGVHYPTDVVGGWLLVAGWLVMLERGLGARHRVSRLRPTRRVKPSISRYGVGSAGEGVPRDPAE